MIEQIFSREITVGNSIFSLTVGKEDLSALYPWFFRYTLTVSSGDAPVALFRTNTCEYIPCCPLLIQRKKIRRKT